MPDVRNPCACCGSLTCYEEAGSGTYNICPVCFWEDDSVQFPRPDYAGGANRPSLNQARANFKEFGAKDRHALPHVRPPKAEEKPN